jgi:hypothetical protein
VRDVFWEPGSNAQLRMDMLGGIPMVLLPEDTGLSVTLRYQPVALGSVYGTLVFSTDDPAAPLKRLPVSGTGISCADGCPLPNAVPGCSAGKCEVAGCVSPYHNADQGAVNGCECREDDGGDIGAVCGGGEKNLGTLPDNGDARTVSGTLHGVDDVDTYWVYMQDEGGIGQLFGDTFDADIELVSTASNIELCIRHDTHDVQGQGCGRGSEECGRRSIHKGGSYGSSDDTDFTVRVRFVPGTAPNCGSYSLRVKNG